MTRDAAQTTGPPVAQRRGAPVKPASSAGSTPAGGTHSPDCAACDPAFDLTQWLHQQRTLADAHLQASRRWRDLGEQANAESIRHTLAGDCKQGQEYHLTEIRCHLKANHHGDTARMMRRRADLVEQAHRVTQPTLEGT